MQITFSSSSTFKLTDSCLKSSLGDEIIILNVDSGHYYELNEVAGFIYNSLIEKPATLEELELGIVNAYDVDQEECQDDLQALLRDLIAEKIIDVI